MSNKVSDISILNQTNYNDNIEEIEEIEDIEEIEEITDIIQLNKDFEGLKHLEKHFIDSYIIASDSFESYANGNKVSRRRQIIARTCIAINIVWLIRVIVLKTGVLTLAVPKFIAGA